MSTIVIPGKVVEPNVLMSNCCGVKGWSMVL